MQLRGEKNKHPVCKNCIMANDITNEEDIIDSWADVILQRF